ncbi:uncharacterized protein [Triticum aestivum]|uniref:uncharacterized protein n=1 Tax=Triticum aestivum TaxID=4565 RepID=UPI001D0079CD|nr:uncharacterized protein LOC123142542 [Triticum aestivum]
MENCVSCKVAFFTKVEEEREDSLVLLNDGDGFFLLDERRRSLSPSTCKEERLPHVGPEICWRKECVKKPLQWHKQGRGSESDAGVVHGVVKVEQRWVLVQAAAGPPCAPPSSSAASTVDCGEVCVCRGEARRTCLETTCCVRQRRARWVGRGQDQAEGLATNFARRRRGCADCDQAGGGGDQTGRLGAAGTKLDEGVERLETGPSAWIMGTTRARGGRRGDELLEEGDGASSWRRGAAQAFGGRRRHGLLEDGDGASSWRMGTA